MLLLVPPFLSGTSSDASFYILGEIKRVAYWLLNPKMTFLCIMITIGCTEEECLGIVN